MSNLIYAYFLTTHYVHEGGPIHRFPRVPRPRFPRPVRHNFLEAPWNFGILNLSDGCARLYTNPTLEYSRSADGASATSPIPPAWLVAEAAAATPARLPRDVARLPHDVARLPHDVVQT